MVTAVRDCAWSSSQPAPSGACCPPGEIWHCLETAGGGACWRALGGAGKRPAVARTAPTAKHSVPPESQRRRPQHAPSSVPAFCCVAAGKEPGAGCGQAPSRPLHLSPASVPHAACGPQQKRHCQLNACFRNRTVFRTVSQAGHPRRPWLTGGLCPSRLPAPVRGSWASVGPGLHSEAHTARLPPISGKSLEKEGG